MLAHGVSKFPMKDKFGRVTGYSDAAKAQQICIHSEMSMLWAWKSSILWQGMNYLSLLFFIDQETWQ